MNKVFCFLVFIFVLNFDLNHCQNQNGLERKTNLSEAASSCNTDVLSGTSLGIKEIFIGRCFYFINIVQKKNCEFHSKKYNCTEIWDLFYSISVKNSKNISDYNPFLDLVDHIIPENKSLFWSGVKTEARECI